MRSPLVTFRGAASEPTVTAAGAIGLDLDLIGGTQVRSGARPAHRRDLGDRVARVLIVALFSFMAVRIGADFMATGRLTGLLLLASEALVVIMTVFRARPPPSTAASVPAP